MANVIKTPEYYIYDKVELVRLIDADTIEARIYVDIGFHIETKTEGIRFRIRNYDAPESYRPKTDAEKAHGLLANGFALTLLLAGIKELRSYKEGVYNRWGADVILMDGRDYGTTMIENGYAKKETY